MTTFNASANRASIVAAINAAAAEPGDDHTVQIAAGTVSDFTTGYTKTIPKKITVQGAGAVSATANGASTTGTDQTTILDRTGAGVSMFDFTVSQGGFLTVADLCVKRDGSSAYKDGWALELRGYGERDQDYTYRVTRCHLWNTEADSSVALSVTDSGFRALFDHIYLDLAGGADMGLIWQNVGGEWGDDIYAAADFYGTNKFLFFEDCRFRNGYSYDLNGGGLRVCFRYNTHYCDTLSTTGKVANHGLAPHRSRGSRCTEMYRNNISVLDGNSDIYVPMNGGTGLFWGNNVSNFGSVFVDVGYHRNQLSSSWGDFSPVPDSWDYCNGSHGSVWDNLVSPGVYYPAFGQPARGQGDLLYGATSDVSSVVNTARGNQRLWPRELLSPYYVWGNTLTNMGGLISGWNAALFLANRDYYMQFGTHGESGSFNGSKGVGQGSLTLAQLQSAYPASGCTPGVAYWSEADEKLYVVSDPTNTDRTYYASPKQWLTYYTPYTYPHPLQGGASPVGNIKLIVV